MDHAPRRWVLNGLRPMLLPAIGLNLLLELALRVIERLLDWTCFWPRFWPRLGSEDAEAYVALLPVMPVANLVVASEGCVETAWLLPVAFLGIALTIGAAFAPTGRFRLRAICPILALTVGLGFMRTVVVIAFSDATWPLTYYLRVDFPTAIDTFLYWSEPVGILIIDLGFLLWAIALGRRIARGPRRESGAHE